MNSDDDSGRGMTPKQVAAIGALMSEPTIAKAAARAGVHERTLRAWLGRDDFRRVLRQEQSTALAGATARLQDLAATALDTLELVMEDGEAPHASRVTAARAVLELAHERVELAELTERIDELERQRTGGGGWTRS